MKTELRILILEDNPTDVDLALQEIKTVFKNFEYRVVEKEDDFIFQIDDFQPDIIISDYQLPSFNGMLALQISLSKDPLLPVIILTGSMNEDTAVECMKAGASDYVIKEHMRRLGSSMLNALEQAETRRKKSIAEKSLIANEERYRYMFAHNPQPMWIYDIESLAFLEVNAAAVAQYGYSRDEFLNLKLKDIHPPDDVPTLLENLEQNQSSYGSFGVWRHLKKNGALIYAEIYSQRMEVDGKEARHVMVVDVTEKKQTEDALARSEEKYRSIFDNVQDVYYQVDLNGSITEISPSIKYYSEFSREELIGRSVNDLYYNNVDRLGLISLLKEKGQIQDYEIRLKTSVGKQKYGSINARLVLDEEGKPHHIDGSIRDITDRIISARILAKNEEKFRNLFLHNAAPNLILDGINLKIVDANHAASRFYGWSLDELKNLKISDINIASSETIQAAFHSVFENKEGHFLFQHKLKNGAIRDVEVYASEVEISGHSYVHTIVQDITAKKNVEEQLRLLSKSMEQSPVSVVITNSGGTIEYVNQKFVDTTGYTREEAVGKNPRILKSGYHDLEFYTEIWNTILSGKEWSGEFQNKRKNGELFWEKASISPLLDDSGIISHFVGIKEDFTERRKMLQELMEAKEKAETSDKLKSAFINNISHEVRTPLNGIMGFSEMLINPELSESMKKQFSDIIRKSGLRLLNTINSYMDISLIVSGNIEVVKKVFILNTLLDDLFNDYNKLCLEKNIELKIIRPAIPDNLQIESDQEIFHKILNYLLNNALKFTQKGSIEFGFRKLSKTIEFFVKDTGIGIEENKLKVIFDSFSQGDASLTRGYEGSGLGLTIASGLTRLLGSSLQVHSEVGVGSSFFFSMTDKIIIYTPITSHHEPPKAPRLIPNPVILVAEDDDFNYKFIEIVLKKEGFIVLRAENGKIAVKICHEHPGIDVILMDMKMPEMSGMEATQEIRRFLPKIPIIALTAYVSSQDEYMAYLNGCDEFLPKPINRSKLLSVIRSYI